MISTYKLTCCLSLLLFTASYVSAGYTSNAENALRVLQQWYNPNDGLWNTCGWWNGANCMTAIADLAAADHSVIATATEVFATTYKQASALPNEVLKVSSHGRPPTFYGPPAQKSSSSAVPPSKFCNSCYDDNGWWALAWIAAYDVTQEMTYLVLAEGIFTTCIAGGGPTQCNNGGIYWCTTSKYVNAIANELYLSVAAHLANRPTSKRNQYKSTALSQWNWFKTSGMINAHNLINDGLTGNCTNNGYPVWTYNQGVILGALVELNTAAPDPSYLSTAHAIAGAAISNLTDVNMVLHEKGCEPNCDGGDVTQFKGIFVRNLVKLHQVAPMDLYVKFFLANANSVWANDRNLATGQLSFNWAGPSENPANASTHSSALDALVAPVAVGKP